MSARILDSSSNSSRVKCLASDMAETERSSKASSSRLSVVAVVSQIPGCVRADGGSLLEGRTDVDVTGGICREMETEGVRVTEAIMEREILPYTVAIAFASDDIRCRVAYRAGIDIAR